MFQIWRIFKITERTTNQNYVVNSENMHGPVGVNDSENLPGSLGLNDSENMPGPLSLNDVWRSDKAACLYFPKAFSNDCKY